MTEKEILSKAMQVLDRVEQDINWMMNNQKLLNPFVFEYLHEFMESEDVVRFGHGVNDD